MSIFGHENKPETFYEELHTLYKRKQLGYAQFTSFCALDDDFFRFVVGTITAATKYFGPVDYPKIALPPRPDDQFIQELILFSQQYVHEYLIPAIGWPEKYPQVRRNIIEYAPKEFLRGSALLLLILRRIEQAGVDDPLKELMERSSLAVGETPSMLGPSLATFKQDTLLLLWTMALEKRSRQWRPLIEEALSSPQKGTLFEVARNVLGIDCYENWYPMMLLEKAGILTYERFSYFANKYRRIHDEVFSAVVEWSSGSEKTVFIDRGTERDEYAHILAERPVTEKFLALCQRYADEVLAPGLADDTPIKGPTGSPLVYRQPRFLLGACRYVESHKNYSFKKTIYSTTDPEMDKLLHIFINSCPKENEDLDKVAASLNEFKQDTLLLAGCLSYHWRHAFEKALGMAGFADFIDVLYSMGEMHPPEFPGAYTRNEDLMKIGASPDPEIGVFNRQKLIEASGRLGKENLEKIENTIRDRIKCLPTDALFMVDAALGDNRDEVMKKFEKRSHLAVRAYGALPGKNDIKERYMKIKEFEEGAKQFGQIRSTNEKATAKGALANLAQVAGVRDTIRLEWALGIGTDALKGLERFERTIDQYEVLFAIVDAAPFIEVRKDGKELSSVPSSLKSQPGFMEFKQASEKVKAISKQYRRIFEDLMCSGEWMTLEEFETLRSDILARQILSRLIIMDRANNIGFPDFDKLPEKMRIIHPFELAGTGKLTEAQLLVVKNNIKQPFRQAFRELYVVTPAEKETTTFSNRFAGAMVNEKQIAAILTAIGWSTRFTDYLTKHFKETGIVAVLRLEHQPHFLGENATNTLGKIFFSKRMHGDRFDLVNVPSIIFSEIMRDVDLLVSKAGAGEVPDATSSTMEMRADVARRLIEVLGLDRITIEPPNIIVTGNLAEYRIHLGSGSVFAGKTRHLCIVPANRLNIQRIYLPFEDGDLKTAEIISKMLYLRSDDQIKDGSILSQIKQSKERNP